MTHAARLIERNVREALELAPRHAAAMKGSREHEELGRRLAALDAEIDEAVCALYGLTDAQKGVSWALPDPTLHLVPDQRAQ